MKNWLLLTIAMLVIGVLAACAPEREESATAEEPETDTTEETETNETEKKEEVTEADKPEKLVVWEDKDKGIGLDAAIASFEEEFGIPVEYREMDMATEIREQLRLDGPTGQGPDVVTLPHDQIGQVVIEGLIAPLEVEETVTGIYTESSIAAQTYDGKLYGLPKATETPVFIYNKELMPEPVATFDELFKFSKEMAGTDQYGFLALWDNFYFGNSIMQGHGGYVFGGEDGVQDSQDIGVNNEGAVEGAAYIQQWYEEIFPSGIIGESGGSAKDGLFQEGKVASVMDGPWAFQGLNEIGMDYGVTPLPTLPNGEYPITFMGVKGWHVSNFSQNKEWATILVEWIANEENAKIRFEETKEIPPVKTLIDDPIIAEDEGAQAVAIQSERAIPMPNIPEMAEVWEPMAQALQLIATGDSEPQEALEEAHSTISSQIELNHSGN
ncbi:extracellular solute-binding protein [Oceanobacillus piezotolerans]|uniref:Maltodextrin-binding protein n=1 Tax=Oceanobacillus piezotolerans TaxID=2448030 RepID=A0A498DAU3_9BACI|nr:extracellular solute-binding protein [Oceanobacillus piezotolerans]RLL46708.1 extracellular solute-binding protein [Oceanobacillus piezotolerans]